MISVPTVLVLGAGASHHCRYPLGRELVASLCRLRGTEALKKLPNSWSNVVEDFLETLSFSDPSSIDAFLERNRSHGELGKYLIAMQLKSHEDISQLFPPGDAGWYRYLFDALLDNGEPNFDRSALTVVTFNYDRSLEAYFITRLRSQFRMKEEDALSAFERLRVIHVHGILGEFPEFAYQRTASQAELLEISQKIQIIHELDDSADQFCNPMFRDANRTLVDAERIYFLGFGFHPDNMRRFRFFDERSTAGKLLKATASGLGNLDVERLRKRLAPMGFPEDAFGPHQCNAFFNYTADLD